MLACYQLDPTEHIWFKSYLKIIVFIPENAFKNIVCNMSANCLGLEVLVSWGFGPLFDQALICTAGDLWVQFMSAT